MSKFYKLLADALRNAKPLFFTEDTPCYWNMRFQWEQDVKMVAVILKATDPKFDKEEFLTAAGVE